MRREFIPVAVQLVGNVDNWGYSYTPMGIRYPQRQAAILAGIRHFGHDDFVIAILRGDTLVGIAWQYEDRPPDDFADEAPGMAEGCGWNLPKHLAEAVGRG